MRFLKRAAFLVGIKMCAISSAAPLPTRPNIVFILIDDMGWKDLGCTGSTFYETPRIDALAKEGMQFTCAYAACPVCSPSRAAILTGQYPARIGLTNYIGGDSDGLLLPPPYVKHLPKSLPNLARALHRYGYQTWHIGKWHLGQKPFWPTEQGFDVNIAGCAAGHPETYFSPYRIPTLPDGPDGEYLTDRLTDEAINLLKNRDPSRPFYLNLWHYAVHVPIESPPALVKKYQAKAHRLGLDRQVALIPGEYFPTLQKRKERVQRRVIQSDPAYAAMIENLDTNVGRLLQTLDDLHLTDSTIVIFTSDNGGLATAEGSPTSNLPLQDGKGWVYEGGLRVPLIVRWPGVVKQNSKCATPVIGVDFFPTLLHCLRIPQPRGVIDGVSIMPLLKQTGDLQPRDLFWHYPHYGNQGGTPAAVVRSGNFKLIEFFEDHRDELYDLKNDPGELGDLAGQRPAMVKAMKKKLDDWLDAVGAKFPTPNPAFTPAQ